MICRVCKNSVGKTRYIDLYVFGSEGLRVCQNCENEIAETVRKLAAQKQRARFEAYRKRKGIEI